MSGGSILGYWLSAFTWDLLMYMVPMCTTLILLHAFDIKAFLDYGAFAAVAWLLLGFGLATVR